MIVRHHIVKFQTIPRHGLFRTLLLVGPGIICIGYTIGTGAVTKLATAGARFGLQLLWVLPISGLLYWVLMEASGRYAAVTGRGALQGFRLHLRGGRWLALLILAGVVIGQWTGLPVLVNLVSQLICDGLRPFIPSAIAQSQGAMAAMAALLLGGVYWLLAVGRYALLEKVMVALVALMVIGFAGAVLLIRPAAEMFLRGIVPCVPGAEGGGMLIPALVGTTIAAPTFLVYSLLIQGKTSSGNPIREQRLDALVSTLVIIIPCASVMACAAGTLYLQDLSIHNITDMINGLERTSGRLAAGLFLLGSLGAGLSSIIPIVMILPLLIADYRQGKFQIQTTQFRVLTALACLVGLTGPVFGDQLMPFHRVASQIAQVFVLPLVVGGIYLLLNRAELMGGQKAGFWLNTGLAAAFGFSLIMSGSGLAALSKRFT